MSNTNSTYFGYPQNVPVSNIFGSLANNVFKQEWNNTGINPYLNTTTTTQPRLDLFSDAIRNQFIQKDLEEKKEEVITKKQIPQVEDKLRSIEL